MPTRTRRLRTRTATPDTTLVDALAAICSPTLRGRAALADRIAVTLRPCAAGGAIKDFAVELDGFRMLVLGRRFCAGPGGRLFARTPLAIYRATVDLPGTGRIAFARDAVFDAAAAASVTTVRPIDPRRAPVLAAEAVALAQASADVDDGGLAGSFELPRFYWAFRGSSRPVLEAGRTPVEWAASEVRIGTMRAWPQEFFARDPEVAHDVHPVDGTPRPDGVEGAKHGGWVPGCQEPDAIYTYLSPFRGRRVRNPAFGVLRRHGLIPAAVGFKAWREAFTRQPAAGRAFLGQGDDEVASIEAYRDAPAEHTAAPGDLTRLVADLKAAATAAMPGSHRAAAGGRRIHRDLLSERGRSGRPVRRLRGREGRGGIGGQYGLPGNDGALSIVPEPSSLLLTVASGIVLITMVRSRSGRGSSAGDRRED